MSSNKLQSVFKVGDEIITINNTPVCPEGMIGIIVESIHSAWVVEETKTGKKFVINEEDMHVLVTAKVKESALDKQVSGNHYKDCGIQPIEYIHTNGLDYFEGNAVKYITRHRKKNGKADIEKAIHYLELLLELEYKDESK